MKVHTPDPAEGEEVGSSELTAEFPQINPEDQPTGYVIIDKGIGPRESA